MLRLFGLHSREQFQVRCYASGPDDGSTERATVARDCDSFVDVSLWSPQQTAELVPTPFALRSLPSTDTHWAACVLCDVRLSQTTSTFSLTTTACMTLTTFQRWHYAQRRYR